MGWPTPSVNPPIAIKRNAKTVPSVPIPRTAGTTAIATLEIKSATSTNVFLEYADDNDWMKILDNTEVAPRTARSAPIIIGETPTDSPTNGINATKISKIASKARAASICEAIPGKRRMLNADGFVPGSTVTMSWVAVVAGGCEVLSIYSTGTAIMEATAPTHKARLILKDRSVPPA